MTDPIDALENLTAIETTTKLLVNAFIRKTNDEQLALNGIYRQELIDQTTIFLSQTHKLLVNLSNTFNLTIDHSFSSKITKPSISNNENEENKTLSFENYTLDDIIQNRVDILSHCPLVRDLTQKHLIDIACQLRHINDLDNLMLKAYLKIMNNEEQLCCNYDGNNGKLPYPRYKCFLLDLLIKLTLDERHQTIDDHDRRRLYLQCEKTVCSDMSTMKNCLVNIDFDENINAIDEQNLICSLFQQIIPQEDIKRIVLAKQDISTKWNDNETCIYYARPVHLLAIKQKWLERYPCDSENEIQRWSQCIHWAIEYFMQTIKTRPSKRKTMDASTMPIDHKRAKISLTFDEKIKEIDRTQFDMIGYATKFIHLIHDENSKTLPSFEQLKLLKRTIFRFYWTSNQQKTWSQILGIIGIIFVIESNDDFRHVYCEQLMEKNKNNQIEIERLLQLTL